MKYARPCSHCGATDLYTDHHDRNYGGQGYYQVACACGAAGPHAENEDAALAGWNQRQIEDGLRDQLTQALDGVIAALEKAQELRDQRDAALAIVKRFVDGINDEWRPMFIGNGVLTDDEGKLLREAEAAVGR